MAYSFINFLRPAIYIFLMPLYLHVLSEQEYGLNDLMLICGAFFMILVTLRINSAMLTVYYDYLDDENLKKKYLSNSFSFSIVVGCLIGLVFWFLGPSIFDSLFKSEVATFYPYGLIVLVYAIIGEINATYFIYLRNEKDLIGYLVVVGAQILTTIILQLIFVLILKWGVVGLLAANLVSNVIVFIMILLREKNILTLNFDSEMIRKSIRFSVALIPYLIIWWVLTKGGKFVLERNADLTTVAVFAILVTLSSIVLILAEAVINGLRPFLFEIFATQKKVIGNAKVDLLTKMIVNIPLLVIPVIVLIGSNLQWLTAKVAYLEVGEYITLMVLIIFILVYAKLFYQQMVFVKRSDIVTLLSFLVMIALCSGFYYLVPTMKIWGVLYSTLIANALMSLLFFIAGQHYLRLGYNFNAILLYPILFFGTLYGLEYLCLVLLDWSRSQFGLMQFFVLTGLVIIMNWKSIHAYRSVFLKPPELTTT